jgi:peptide/nickel transport system permease protein
VLKMILVALLRLLAQAGFVALAVGALSFLLMRSLPGDAAFRIAAGRYGYDLVDAAAAESVRRELGLDRSGFEQFVQWLSDLLQFRLGESMVSGIPVALALVAAGWQEVWMHCARCCAPAPRF